MIASKNSAIRLRLAAVSTRWESSRVHIAELLFDAFKFCEQNPHTERGRERTRATSRVRDS